MPLSQEDEMAKFLASVIGVEEAEIALLGDADIIDLKNPADGALGALSPDIVTETVAFVGGRKPVSAVCGNLPMVPGSVAEGVEKYAGIGVDYLKIGLLPEPQTPDCIRAVAPFAARVKLIAVLFADKEPDFTLLPVLAENGFHGVMLDTAEKGSGGLLQHLSHDRVSRFVEEASALGLKVGLAGSLEAPDVPRLLPLQPDFLGFRSALCGTAGREGGIEEEAVKRIRALIPLEEASNGAAQPDYRLLGRGLAPWPDPGLGTDKIFLREFILPVGIGAYSFERGRTQKVRFDVTAEVRRLTNDPQDMRHVVSYDIIMDGIRTIVARGHVDLAETLAEKVATHVLSDPRVERVVVRVEKLEIAPGSVGVEIERVRTDREAGAR